MIEQHCDCTLFQIKKVNHFLFVTKSQKFCGDSTKLPYFIRMRPGSYYKYTDTPE